MVSIVRFEQGTEYVVHVRYYNESIPQPSEPSWWGKFVVMGNEGAPTFASSNSCLQPVWLFNILRGWT